jgi:NitT/TauT family transport system permease protein
VRTPTRGRFREIGDPSPTLPRVAVAVVALLGILVLWKVLLVTDVVSEFVLPDPADVARALVDQRGAIASASWVTLSEVLLGFGTATAMGVLLSLGLTYSRTFNSAVYPPLVILHAIPKTAIAPILLIWFGFGLAPKIVLSSVLAFFPILIATIAGLRSVDPELHELARSLRASLLSTFWKIDFPHALPSFFAGLRTATHLAVTGAVIAEFVAGSSGLAFLLNSASAQFQTELAFAVAIVISMMSASLFGAVVVIERLFVPWARSR